MVVKILDLVAFLWVRRAPLVELAGAVCVVVAAAYVAPALAWLVTGVALVFKAAEIDRKWRAK